MRKLYIFALILTIIIFALVIIATVNTDHKNTFFRTLSNIFGKTPESQNDQPPIQNPDRFKKQLYVSLILDDAGVNQGLEILNFSEPLNISILPDSRYLKLWLKKIKNKPNIETLIHIPMASISHPQTGLGPGMSLTKIKKQLDSMLNQVKIAKGANNHEGSFATSDTGFMHDFFNVFKEYNLYFIDSLTTPDSHVSSTAKKFGIPVLKRTHFIDNKKTKTYIKRQLKKTIDFIKKNGYGILIGHTTTKELLPILNEILPEFKKNKIKFVHISDLLRFLKKAAIEVAGIHRN